MAPETVPESVGSRKNLALVSTSVATLSNSHYNHGFFHQEFGRRGFDD
jgi:hypothetical protein